MGPTSPLTAADKASRAFLAFNAMIFIGLGVRGLLEPAAHMAGFGLLNAGPMLLAEIRANYGGMHIGMGLMFLIGAWLPRWRPAAMLALLLFCGGLVLGRLVSWGQEGTPSNFVMQLLVVEVVASLIAAGLLAALNRKPA